MSFDPSDSARTLKAGHRIAHIDLDDETILWRNADVEQERRVAMFDSSPMCSAKTVTGLVSTDVISILTVESKKRRTLTKH